MADELAIARHHLAELGKMADRAALVLATIEAEDIPEGEMLQEIIDGISKWAPSAIDQQQPGPVVTELADLRRKLEIETERANYAWRNTNIIEKSCQALMTERDALLSGIAAENEACAHLCEEVVTYPSGHGGQWEGYGPVKTTRNGKECAAEIRKRKGISHG